MADNTLLSASTGTGDIIRTVHKSTYKTPVSLIDVGGTSTGSEAILGDSTHAMPVSIRAGSTTLPVSLTTASTMHIAPLTTGSTIHIAPLTTASTVHIAPLTTASTIHVAQSGTWTIAPLTTASTIHVTGTFANTAATTDDAVFTPGSGIGTPIMGLVTSDEVSTGDVGVLAMTTGRQLKATLYDSTGGELVQVSTLSVSNAGTFPVQVSAFSSSVSVLIDGSHADDAAFTPATNKGVAVMGVVTDDTVSTGDVGALAMSQNRILKVALYNSTGVEQCGVSAYNKVGTTVVETTNAKVTAGNLYGLSAYNNTLAPIYVKLYNTTAAPTTSNTAALRYIIPATTVTGAAGLVEDYSCPVLFSSGIGLRVTGGSLLDSDTAIASASTAGWTLNLRYL
jgi:hypothetical protein